MIIAPGLTFYQTHIAFITDIFMQYERDPLTIKNIFDKKINLPALYPPFASNPINEGIEYSNIDVFFIIVSSITTLRNKQPTVNNHDFVLFDSYIKPGYDDLMNSTKRQLHNQISNNLEKLKHDQLILIAIISSILLAASIYLCLKVYGYFNSMWQVMDIIIQFNNTEIEKIILYWHKVAYHFRKI